MIAVIHLLAADPGSHAVAHAAPLAALPALFRRLRWRREEAAPEADSTVSGAGGLTFAQQQAHADALHRSYAALADEQRRPVNGRSLGTLPRLTTPDHPPWSTASFPVYGTAPQLDVAAAEQARADAGRAWRGGEAPGADILAILAIVAKRLREVL